jgi:hypothetical protein
MSEQQLAAVKQALEALEKSEPLVLKAYKDSKKPIDLYSALYAHRNAITALQSIISQDALHKMAEESRTSGLRLDDWDKIGCVNHDCDKCKAVQEPVGEVYRHGKSSNGTPWHGIHWFDEGVNMPHGTPLYTAPPAAPVQEPVAVVSGYYGGQCVVLPINPARLFNSGTAFYTAPQPAAQKPWVGLTDAEVMQTMGGDWTSQFYFARAIEAKLKEKNT